MKPPLAAPAHTALAQAHSGPGWLDRCLAWRDRLVAGAGFREWAASFVLTRPIARRRARALFDLVAGFVYSQVLLACVRLQVFDRLAAEPMTAAALAPRLGLSEEACRRLLDAAVALRLLSLRRGARYGLGPLGAPMVDNPALAAMVEHHATLYADLRDPVALLQRAGQPQAATGLARYWAYSGDTDPATLCPDQVAAYSQLMSASQPLVAEEILAAYPIGYHRSVLDVGGGEGRFLVRAAREAGHLQMCLFDLPAVAERARQAFTLAGLGDRARAVGGDFFHDPLPTGSDLITLIRVLHDHDDDAALQLLRRIRQALPEDGCLLLAEPMAHTGGAEAMGDAYFGFYLLAMGHGRPRTPDAIAAMLQAAGFDHLEWPRTRLPLQARLVVARAAAPGARS